MSINVYFSNEIKKHLGFKITPRDKENSERTSVNEITLFNKDGRLYAQWDEKSPIPDELKSLVDQISYYDFIPKMGHRESGVYYYETARCELTLADHGSSAQREKLVYKLKIIAKEIEDIRTIVHRIKTGTIRPEETYEGPQGGKSRLQLEQELAELTEARDLYLEAQKNLRKANELLRSATTEKERLGHELEETQEKLREVVEIGNSLLGHLTLARKQGDAICELAYNLKSESKRWPFCRKKKVVSRIVEAFNDAPR